MCTQYFAGKTLASAFFYAINGEERLRIIRGREAASIIFMCDDEKMGEIRICSLRDKTK